MSAPVGHGLRPTVATLRREVAAIRARLAPDRPVLSPLEVAERIGVRLDDWQVDLVTAPDRQLLMCCSRQVGKSLTAALIAAHAVTQTPGALVLAVAPSLRQSQELYGRTKDVIAALGDAVPPIVEESAQRLVLANGSRLMALPGGREDTIRGFPAVDVVVLDEAARISDAAYEALRPMVAVSGGKVVALSTPWGKRGWYWKEWSEGGEAWRRASVRAAECPRIPTEWLAREQASMPDFYFRQEFGCEFIEAEGALFSLDDIERAVDPSIVPFFGGSHAA